MPLIINAQTEKRFWLSVARGLFFVTAIACGVIAVCLLIFGIGDLMPSLYGYWPLTNVYIPLSATRASILNGLAWLTYLVIMIVLLYALALIGGYDPKKSDVSDHN